MLPMFPELDDCAGCEALCERLFFAATALVEVAVEVDEASTLEAAALPLSLVAAARPAGAIALPRAGPLGSFWHDLLLADDSQR